jgi:myo-inositol 2-dehydrogenase / D-chiro-inositol 1-dehydrogenase
VNAPNPAAPVRVGVIGTGLMGEVHARNLRYRTAGAELLAVADVDRDRAAALATALDVHAHQSGDDVIGDGRVSAVVIASSDASHAHYVAAGLRAGKPTLCEKPLAISADEAWALVEQEVSGGIRLTQVGFMREFDATHAAVRVAVTDGRLGRVVMFRGSHINPFYGWTVDVERAITQSLIHDVHSARFLTGREIVEVYATQVNREPGDASATRFVTVSFQFDDGAVGLLDLNMDSGYGYAVAAEVVGTAGTARTVNPTSVEVRSGAHETTDITQGWAARFAAAYQTELDAWVDSVQRGNPVGPSAYDGYVANVVADACVASIRTGVPVRVMAQPRPALYTVER